MQLLEQILENQVREFEIKSRELEIEKQKDANAFQFSREALSAQERDRKHERECKRGERRDRYWLIAIMALILAGLIGAALAMGHKDVAIELVKAVILISAGAAGGYGLAKKKQDDPE
ncbi:hypothetical protein TEP_15065 [Stenotrophomonas sp. TEPEL]|nr:hypothetical protein TEP_15065 [Stenotrophomonas sp. TEPEL]